MSDHDYDLDFYAWLQVQAGYLQAKDWGDLALEHLIEEIGGTAK